MKIREAKKEDISQMMEIIKSNNPKYPKNIAFKELNEMFSKALNKPTYIVAEEKGKIVAFNGFIPSWVDNMVVNLFWANTHLDYQNRGIQTKLIKNLISRIKKIRKPKVKMILISTKIPSFFKKFGFKIIQRQYDGDYNLMGLKLKWMKKL